MTLLEFAQHHVRNELVHIIPEVARTVSPDSYIISRHYLGVAVTFLTRNGEPALIYKKATTDLSLSHFTHHAITCAARAQSCGVRTQPFYGSCARGDGTIVILGWVPGTPVPRCAGKGLGLTDALKRTIELITRLHCATRRASDGTLLQLQGRVRWWESLLSRLSSLSEEARQGVSTVCSFLLDWMPHLPAVLMHGDCATANVIHTNADGMVLIDWELGLPEGPPAIDLVSLLLDYYRPLSRADRRAEVFRQCFLSSTPISVRCWDVVRSYAARLGVPEAALPLLVTVTFVKMTAEDVHFLLLHSGPLASQVMIQDLALLGELLERWALAPPSRPTHEHEMDNRSSEIRSALRLG